MSLLTRHSFFVSQNWTSPKLSTCPLNSIGTRAHRAQCKQVGSIAMPFSHCESEQVWCVKIALERLGDEIFGHVESTELVLKSNKCPSIELSRTVTLWWWCLRWVSCRYVSLCLRWCLVFYVSKLSFIFMNLIAGEGSYCLLSSLLIEQNIYKQSFCHLTPQL